MYIFVYKPQIGDTRNKKEALEGCGGASIDEAWGGGRELFWDRSRSRLCDQVITVYRYAKDRRQTASILPPPHHRLCIHIYSCTYVHTSSYTSNNLSAGPQLSHSLSLCGRAGVLALGALCTCARFSVSLISQSGLFPCFLIPYSCNVVGFGG